MNAEQASLEEYGAAMIEAVRDAGERRALEASGDWAAAAWRAIVRLAHHGAEFTADDVTAEVGPAPSNGAAGALFRAARSAGLIVRVGYRTSRRVSRHGGVQAVWRGRGAT